MADLIKADEAKIRLKKVPEWELEKKHIERTFEFDDFTDAIDFVNAVAEVAEEEEHHPDIDIRFNKVRLVLSTHSKGGLTDLLNLILLCWRHHREYHLGMIQL